MQRYLASMEGAVLSEADSAGDLVEAAHGRLRRS